MKTNDRRIILHNIPTVAGMTDKNHEVKFTAMLIISHPSTIQKFEPIQVTLEQAMKAQRGSRCIALLFL
jgi:hypothetical protein